LTGDNRSVSEVYLSVTAPGYVLEEFKRVCGEYERKLPDDG